MEKAKIKLMLERSPLESASQSETQFKKSTTRTWSRFNTPVLAPRGLQSPRKLNTHGANRPRRAIALQRLAKTSNFDTNRPLSSERNTLLNSPRMNSIN
jgi:hypothetical protein